MGAVPHPADATEPDPLAAFTAEKTSPEGALDRVLTANAFLLQAITKYEDELKIVRCCKSLLSPTQEVLTGYFGQRKGLFGS